MKNYKIAVLLSAYNGEKYISQQIKSIMNQTIVDHLTLIVRNDGSTDNTQKILSNLRNKYANLVVINGKNIGLIRSFFKLLNISVKKHNFDYYAFSDQDDYWLPMKMEKAVKALKKNDNRIPLLYGCRSLIVDRELRPTGFKTQSKDKNIIFFNTAIQNIIPGHNQVLNKKLAQILTNTEINLREVYSQDLWITNVAAVSGKILFENESYTLYRMHKNNQLGYGKNKYDRIISHLRRLRNKEPQKISLQLKYFASCFGKFLSFTQKKEIIDFFVLQNNFKDRIKYISATKLYRQTKSETFFFKILYLLGFYNLSQ